MSRNPSAALRPEECGMVMGMRWRQRAGLVLLLAALGAALGAPARATEELASGGPAANMVVTRVQSTPAGLVYDSYEAGGGADFAEFWPASSVKLTVAVAALEYLADRGFTGAAEISFDDAPEPVRVADLYDDALRWSSNAAYDDLLRLMGLDWLNEAFLTPRNGFSRTVIERFYDGESLGFSPGMTLREGDLEVHVPERFSDGGFGCPPSGNCTTLGELADVVRRVALDEELPAEERFGVAPQDLAGVRSALLGAEGFMDAGIREALGEDALIYKKPGWWPGRDCVEQAFVVSPSTGQRFVMAAAAPDGPEGCEVLGRFAHGALVALKGVPAHSRRARLAQAEAGLVPAADSGTSAAADPVAAPPNGMRLAGSGLALVLLGGLWRASKRRSR